MVFLLDESTGMTKGKEVWSLGDSNSLSGGEAWSARPADRDVDNGS